MRASKKPTTYGVFMTYSVNVKADSIDEFKQIITQKIEKIGKINIKLTLIITEKPPTSFQEQVLFENPPI